MTQWRTLYVLSLKVTENLTHHSYSRVKCRSLAKTCTGVNLNHSMKRSRERSTFWINQVEAISSMCREMDGSPCNIKSAVSGNASGATPFIAPAPSTTRPLALLSRWHFKAPTQTWKAWLPAWSQHNPPPTPFLKRACYPRWARSTPRIHTACHSGTLVKICFVSLINNTPFLLQTQGGRECPSGVHWHCSSLESPFRQETCWKWRRCLLSVTPIYVGI